MTRNMNRMQQQASRSHLQRGFTLLEIILALALTATLMTMLTAGMFSVVRDWDNNASALENNLDESIAILQLERALQGAFPHSYRDPETLGRHVYFEGESNQLSWVSTVSPERRDGLTAWRLFWRGDEGVYLQLAPALSDEPTARLDEAEPRLLLPGYRVSFQYLYEDLEFERLWREDWPAFTFSVLPFAVHVRLEPIDDRNVETLDIVAPVNARQHRSIRPNLELIP
ncbi:MAG TPA: hypothetical protein DD407_04630 [Pseudohongiella sp.]|nr:hypothetical protein [Pseudohongiella sp.]